MCALLLPRQETTRLQAERRRIARRTHPRRVRRVGFRSSIHGTLHHLLPCPNTKTGGGESAAGATTVPAETQASPAYTTQWLHRPRRPPAFPSRFIAFAARDASSQARFARHGGARPLEQQQLCAMASRSAWWCARAATTPEQCARADEGEMRLDRSSSGGGFVSPSARDGSPSLPPISFSPCSGSS
jgi:hypothetical protein